MFDDGYVGPPKASALVTKLADVMAAVERIPKRGRNDFHKYDYATESDIVATVRDELAKRHVMLLPGIESVAREPVGEKGSVLTTLEMRFTFIDGESGERLVFRWFGCGTDKEDKGLYKAMTGGEKYFLLKTFLMPTGDDPERDTTQPPKRARGASPDPPATVVNTQTGEDVPATDRPAAPHGYRYIDDCVLKPSGWFDVTFKNFDSQGNARTYSTKIEALGSVAMQAYERGIPVHIEGKKSGTGKGDWYLNGITTWKPEPSDAELDAELVRQEQARNAGTVA